MTAQTIVVINIAFLIQMSGMAKTEKKAAISAKAPKTNVISFSDCLPTIKRFNDLAMEYTKIIKLCKTHCVIHFTTETPGCEKIVLSLATNLHFFRGDSAGSKFQRQFITIYG